MADDLVVGMLVSLKDEVKEIRKRLDDLLRLEGEHKLTRAAVDQLAEDQDEIERRIKVLEEQSPIYELVKKIVFGLVWFVVGAVVLAGLAYIIRTPSTPSTTNIFPPAVVEKGPTSTK